MLRRIICIFLTIVACSCSGRGKYNPWNPNWNNTSGGEEVENPEEVNKAKPRYLWVDASANFKDYADSRENIAADLKKACDAGFTDIVVDVRPSEGDVLFASSVAEPLTKASAWVGGTYKWIERTADFDYLQAFIDAGHALGLKVHAAINTFVGGYLCPYSLGSAGMLFRNGSRRDWATVVNRSDGLKNTMDLLDSGTEYGPKFLNPADSRVQNFILAMLGELAAYDVDGICLDRCRFSDDGLMADFSETTRALFEAYRGSAVSNWPSDIFSPGTKSISSANALQKQWLEFRVKTIHDFVEKAAAKVHSVNPDVKFGVYVGAWYSDYYPSGVNWASPKYDPAADGYFWASSSYGKYGYADHLDYLLLGAYAGTDSIRGTTEWTMQGFCTLAGQKLKGDVPYAGGPDIGNPSGWPEGGRGAEIQEAIDVCMNNSDGFFCFDMIHVKTYNYWDAFKAGFDKFLKQ